MTELNSEQSESVERYRNVLTGIGAIGTVLDEAITAYVECLTSKKLNSIRIFPVFYPKRDPEDAEIISKAMTLYNEFQVDIPGTDQQIKFKDLVGFLSGTRVTDIDCNEWSEGWNCGTTCLQDFCHSALDCFDAEFASILASYSSIDKGYYTFGHCFKDNDADHLPIDQYALDFFEPEQIVLNNKALYRIGKFDINYGYDEFDNPLPIKWATTKWSKRMPYPIYIAETALAHLRQYCSEHNLQNPAAVTEILTSLETNDFTGVHRFFGYGYIPATDNSSEIGVFKTELENDRLIALAFRSTYGDYND